MTRMISHECTFISNGLQLSCGRGHHAIVSAATEGMTSRAGSSLTALKMFMTYCTGLNPCTLCETYIYLYFFQGCFSMIAENFRSYVHLIGAFSIIVLLIEVSRWTLKDHALLQWVK